jgi:hypothetical protein
MGLILIVAGAMGKQICILFWFIGEGYVSYSLLPGAMFHRLHLRRLIIMTLTLLLLIRVVTGISLRARPLLASPFLPIPKTNAFRPLDLWGTLSGTLHID